MKLYGHEVSPFVARCCTAADAKGQLDKLEMAEIPGGFKSAAHLAATVLGKIPYFEADDGTILIESAAISAYLDAVMEGPSLAGATAMDRAQIQMMVGLVDQYFASAFVSLWPGRADTDTVKRVVAEDMPRAMDVLEKFAGGGDYLVGGGFSLADAALIPWLFHLRVFGKKVGLPDFGGRPKLSSWAAAMASNAVAKRTFDRASTALRAMS